MNQDPPARRNNVRKTTESKYVVLSPWPLGDRGSTVESARVAMDEKYATETPVDT